MEERLAPYQLKGRQNKIGEMTIKSLLVEKGGEIVNAPYHQIIEDVNKVLAKETPTQEEFEDAFLDLLAFLTTFGYAGVEWSNQAQTLTHQYHLKYNALLV